MAFGTVLEIPYWNALTAGEFDASATIDASFPASHAAYSLQTLALYQAPGQTVRPDILDWPEVKLAGVAESEGAQIKKCDEKSTWFDRITGRCCIGEVTSDGKCLMKSDGDTGAGGIFGSSIADSIVTSPAVRDAAKRVGLVVLSVLIIAIVIVRMR